MRTRTIAYWTTTLIIAAELVSGAVLDLARTGSTVAPLHHLGYPTYLLSILGPWRLLAAAALGGSTGNVVTPLLLAACAMASWALRPPSRTLGVLSLPGVHAGRGSSGPAQ